MRRAERREIRRPGLPAERDERTDVGEDLDTAPAALDECRPERRGRRFAMAQLRQVEPHRNAIDPVRERGHGGNTPVPLDDHVEVVRPHGAAAEELEPIERDAGDAALPPHERRDRDQLPALADQEDRQL